MYELWGAVFIHQSNKTETKIMFLYENCGVEKYEKNTLFDNQCGFFLFQNRIAIILLNIHFQHGFIDCILCLVIDKTWKKHLIHILRK